jgi:hypothetical protein
MAADTEPTKKPLCFVIGPIGQEGTAERRHADLLLHTLVKHVLEAEAFGYQVKRADEDADPGMIGDRMVTDIMHAALVVADLTDLNPNAFYELGIRHSAQKPTIHIAKAGTKLPFDNIAHRTIFVDLTDWRSIEHARSQLASMARAIEAPDYRVSNPITQADASFQMRQSTDPRDHVIADLQERLAALETRLEGRERSTIQSISKQTESIDRIYSSARAHLIRENADSGTVFQLVCDAARSMNLGISTQRTPNGWSVSFVGTDKMIYMEGRRIFMSQ